MKKALILFVVVFMFGCNNLDDKTLQKRKQGIVQSCYVVLQNKPKDKQQRINTYLEKKLQQGHITLEQKEMLLKCLKRTENSKNWSK